MSLDGFIVGPNGESDWIVMDNSFDFESFFHEFDTTLMGRKTFEATRQGGGPMLPGMQTVVCSTTLQNDDYPDVTVVDDASNFVTELKAKPGKDIWLFGGGELFRSLLDTHHVDTIEIAVMPVLLSQGISLLPSGQRPPALRLTETNNLSSGIVGLNYTIDYGTK